MSAPAPQRGRLGLLPRFALLAVTGFLLPAAAVSGLGWSALKKGEEQLLSERSILARMAAARLGAALKRDLDPLLSLGALPDSTPGGFEAAVAPALAEAWHRSRLLHGVFLLATSGEVLLREPAVERHGQDASESYAASLAAAVSRAEPTASGLLGSAADRRLMVFVPLRGAVGAPVRGVAAACVDPRSHRVTALVAGASPGTGASVDFVDATGTVFVSTDEARVFRSYPPSHPISSLAAQHKGAAIRTTDLVGEGSELVAFAPVEGFPWGALVRQGRRAALEPAASLRDNLLWVVPLLGVLALGLALGGARAVRQPVITLTEAAERIAGGDLARPIPPLPADEVGRLGSAFESMRVALALSLDEVRQSNEVLEERVRRRTEELTRLYRELAEREEARLRLLRKVIAAQEEERKRIARELHDETCQTVTALALRAETAAEALGQEAARGPLAEVKELARRALDDLHRVIYDLRPSVLDDLGLFPAVRWFGERNLAPRGISVRYDFDDADLRLTPEAETAVFRAVQEALTNVVRHSRAESVLIQAGVVGDRLSIEIEDDGDGFDPATVAVPSHGGRGLGLLGLKERLELLGGSASVDSAPGDGTRVLLSVPLASVRRDDA